MTDYAKHIEAFQSELNEHSERDNDWCAALTAAIELMKTATPKSPEEEREHCARFAEHKYATRDIVGLEQDYTAGRAAARAEGYAQGQSVWRTSEAEFETLQAELSAAQAEIERLQKKNAILTRRLDPHGLGGSYAPIGDHVDDRPRHRGEPMTDRYQANRDHGYGGGGRQVDTAPLPTEDPRIAELQTKIENLRTAVTEHLANTPKSHAQAVESDNALRAANEASR